MRVPAEVGLQQQPRHQQQVALHLVVQLLPLAAQHNSLALPALQHQQHHLPTSLGRRLHLAVVGVAAQVAAQRPLVVLVVVVLQRVVQLPSRLEGQQAAVLHQPLVLLLQHQQLQQQPRPCLVALVSSNRQQEVLAPLGSSNRQLLVLGPLGSSSSLRDLVGLVSPQQLLVDCLANPLQLPRLPLASSLLPLASRSPLAKAS